MAKRGIEIEIPGFSLDMRTSFTSEATRYHN